MGTVYRARDGASGKRVALKVVHDLIDPSTEFVKRFENEIAAGRRIDHPNIVKVLEAGVIEGHLYLVMELVEGESLAVRLPRLSVLDRVDVIEQSVKPSLPYSGGFASSG